LRIGKAERGQPGADLFVRRRRIEQQLDFPRHRRLVNERRIEQLLQYQPAAIVSRLQAGAERRRRLWLAERSGNPLDGTVIVRQLAEAAAAGDLQSKFEPPQRDVAIFQHRPLFDRNRAHLLQTANGGQRPTLPGPGLIAADQELQKIDGLFDVA
jgi:hypothetical protein